MNKSNLLIKIIPILLMLSSLLFAQNGIVQGYVIDGTDGTPLFGATVDIVELAMGAVTDGNGRFIISAVPPSGTGYTLRSTFVGYGIFTISGVVVNSGETTNQNLVYSADLMTVYDFADNGPYSLRQVILNADSIGGTNTIRFMIPGPTHTIRPSTPLPEITDPVTIDGTNQPFLQKIELDGSLAGPGAHGLYISAGNSVIVGMAINRFNGDGIRLVSNGGNSILANFIGTDPTGENALPNNNGIYISNASNNNIGSVSPESRNIISGNTTFGIAIQATVVDASRNNTITNNYIGLNVDGTGALGNGDDGINLAGATETSIYNNVISGATAGNGIELTGANTINNYISGNLIGTNAAGTGALGNSFQGIAIWAASQTIIGGTTPGQRNIIAGNGEAGILIEQPSAIYNNITGNYIGTDISGTVDLGNLAHGIHIDGAPNNFIGGNLTDTSNVISGNNSDGILISGAAATDNIVWGNLIGTTATGDSPLRNAAVGVRIVDASDNIIGEAGVVSGHRNIIYGGVTISGSSAMYNEVAGNYIGIDIFGNNALGATGDGVFISSGSQNIVGPSNVISGNHSGVFINTGSANRIFGNLIGTNASGAIAVPNVWGIYIDNSPYNLIGGTTFTDKNTISGNTQAGIVVSGTASTDNIIFGNFVGTDTTGTSDVPNQTYGIFIDGAPDNQIGGSTSDSANVISGNYDYGIEISAATATGNLVCGNFVGTDILGTSALMNVNGGILINNAPDNILGGPTSGHRNIVYGGVHIHNPDALRNQVRGNYIGINAAGTDALGNDPIWGVQIFNASENLIGPDNVISGNSDHGILIMNSANQNRVSQNRIGTNASGTIHVSNGVGVGIVDAPGNIIGGTVAEGNLISGNLRDGISIIGAPASDNIIRGNYIGLNATGTDTLCNYSNGIYIENASNTIVGGTQPDLRNVISGNYWGRGIEITGSLATGNMVMGNLIGTDPAGTDSIPNRAGVWIHAGASDNVIGGSVAGSGNVISGNRRSGVDISAPGSNNNRVQGNFIGTNITGDAILGNMRGIFLSNTSNNIIGGTTLQERNLISGNINRGMRISEWANNNQITGNYIGTDLYGQTALANGWNQPLDLGSGILLYKAMDNTISNNLISGNDNTGITLIDTTYGNWITENIIGANASGSNPLPNLGHGIHFDYPEGGNPYAVPFENFIVENQILYNGLNGVNIEYGYQNLISENQIYANTGLGIDLGEDGVTPNDPGDSDSGPHNLQNFPDISSVQFTPGNVEIDGIVNSSPNTPFNLEFFANKTGDPSGYGEGEIFLGSDTVLTNGSGIASFTVTLPLAIFEGQNITATATDPYNNTSEFSAFVGGSQQATVDTSFFPMVFKINEDGEPTITNGSDIQAVKNALQHWEDIGTSQATFNADSLTTLRHAGNDSINLITFTDDEFLLPDGVLAITAKTIVEENNTAHITDVDIVFNRRWIDNSNYRYSTDGIEDSLSFDIESITTHEVGHALGLVHSGVKKSTMFFVLQPGSEARTLETDDVAWASYLYPNSLYSTSFGSITGEVRYGYDENILVAGALILAAHETTGDSVHAYSDADGQYRVPGMPAGSYRLSIQPLDNNVHGYQMRPGHVSEYLKAHATITDFPHEWYNLNDSEDDRDIVPSPAPVNVNAGSETPSIDFVTNRDLTPPSIVGLYPSDGDTSGVLSEVAVTFSEAVIMDSFKVAFSLINGGTAVTGGFNFINNDKRRVLFTPSDPLAFYTTYTLTIDTFVTDIRGNRMENATVITFITELPDIIPPSLSQIDPENNADSVFTSRQITLRFSEPIDRYSLTVQTNQDPGNFSLSNGGDYVAGTFTFVQNYMVAVFSPLRNLDEDTLYTVTLTRNITDLSGNSLDSLYQKQFRTVADAVPAITDFGPPVGADSVSMATAVFADFSEPINTTTVNGTSFSLSLTSGGNVSGTYTFLYDNSRVIFTPNQELLPATNYTFTITQDIADLSGDQLLAGLTNTFTTASRILTPAIFSIVEPVAPVGSDVVINGEGFDPDTSNNDVLFGEVPATVQAATLNSLTVRVPLDASSGDVTVTVNGITSDPYRFYVAVPGEANANTVTANRPTESESRDSAPTPDAAYAYVVNTGANSVSIIDLVNTQVFPNSIPVGYSPLKIDINQGGTRAYVTNYGSNSVSVIDIVPGSPDYNTVIKTIPVGMNPYGVVVTPDDSRVYVANYTSKDISVIDVVPNSGTYNQVVANVRTDSENKDIESGPDATLAFVTHTNGVFIINIDVNGPSADYNTVVKNVQTDSEPDEITISPDATLAFATTVDGNIIVIDILPQSPNYGSVVANVRTESDSEDLDMSPDAAFLYVTNGDANSVSVYELVYSYGQPGAEENPGAVGSMIGQDQRVVVVDVSLNLVETIEDVGDTPFGITIDPVEKRAIVTNIGAGGSVTIIDITTLGAAGPVEAVNLLIEDIQKLRTEGKLRHGEAISLIAKLKSAKRMIERGRKKLAKLRMWKFIKKVKNLMRRNRLSAEDGQALIDAAKDIIFQIDNYLRKLIGDGENDDLIIPDVFALEQNYPNPFNPSTTITFDIPGSEAEGVHVDLKIFNILGQLVRTLVDEHKQPGRYKVTWNGSTTNGTRTASGVYIYRIVAGDFVQVKKMVLIR